MPEAFSEDVHRRAKEVCKLILKVQKSEAPCLHGNPEFCTGESCYVWELIEMGRRGSPE